MGIINVTPDSFSDGGDRFDRGFAIAEGERLASEGADILDIGGESTRPGAAPVPLDEELARTIPVVSALAAKGHLLSIDTRHAEVMRRALDAGAKIVNDVTALTHDPGALAVVAKARCSVVLMHMKGDPQTMQQNPTYTDVVGEVGTYLAARRQLCLEAGLTPDQIAIDPGIGFGKTIEHNLALISHLGELAKIGTVLLGLSRKSFIARLSKGEAPKERLPGSLAGALYGLSQGAKILRVHDVAETLQAVKLWLALDAAQGSR